MNASSKISPGVSNYCLDTKDILRKIIAGSEPCRSYKRNRNKSSSEGHPRKMKLKKHIIRILTTRFCYYVE